MLVKIEEIREGGLELTQPVKLELLSEALHGSGPDTGFRPVAPAPGSVRLTKVGPDVLIKGAYQLTVQTDCKRCAEDTELNLPVQFTVNLVPAKKVYVAEEDDSADLKDDLGSKEAGTFGLDAADQETFDGRTIDLDPILREQVLLALPMDAVCREDCKGLCPQCGQNLNEKKCGCDPKVIDPRLAALKNFKLKPN